MEKRRAYQIKLKGTVMKTRMELATDVTVGQIEVALKEAKGNLTYASRALNIERPVLQRKIDYFPHLGRLLAQIREEVLDQAEHQLLEQVDEGYFPAISMVLRTIGKERGYTERTDAGFELGENAARTSAALIEAMRKGIEEKPEAIDVKDYEWKEEPSKEWQPEESEKKVE
jgi:hypothetical protein